MSCKKNCQQEAISSANNFFHLINLLKCHQSLKMPSSRFGGLQFFVRWQTSSFLDSYPSWAHLILQTWQHINCVSGWTKYFACLRCKQGCKNKKLMSTKVSNFLQTPNSIFCRSGNKAHHGVRIIHVSILSRLSVTRKCYLIT